MEVVSFRIPEDIKKKMKEVDINWSEEVRKFFKARVREHKRKMALEEIDKMLENLPKTEKEPKKVCERGS